MSTSPIEHCLLRENIGCSSKVSSVVLAELAELGLLGPVWDDAAAIDLPGQRLLATIDLIHLPCTQLDLAGQILVQHCANDLYAKGARPLAGLSLILYPAKLDNQRTHFLREVSRGIQTAAQRAAFAVIGGHTMHNPECLIGLALLGQLPPGQPLVPKQGAQPGDRLILTKPLSALYALYAHQSRPADLTQLRDRAFQNMLAVHDCVPWRPEIRACTDISGFGLVGHLLEMLAGTSHGATLEFLPSVVDGEINGFAEAPMCALERNARSYAAHFHGPSALAFDHRLFAPETSGPLLLAVAPHAAGPFLRDLQACGFSKAAEIGEVTHHPGIAFSPCPSGS
ncbi:MAG TPA: selenide, water dikinase SelD [Prosthecobacter sp.]|nr:selenide, water dikinase SelD [Prosthecobacter sp.]